MIYLDCWQPVKKLQYNMSKEHSSQDTRLTPSKLTLGVRRKTAVEETQRALQYYSNLKKNDLQACKQRFFQTRETPQNPIQESLQNRERRKKKKKKIKEISKIRSQRVPHRQTRQARANYREPSSSSEGESGVAQPRREKVPATKPEKRGDVESQSDCGEEGPFEIRPIHECMLQMQKVIDNYLDYQCTHRKKVSISQEELFEFLRTTKYGLNCKKYLNYLNFYNPRLYLWADERLLCQEFKGEVIEARLQLTHRKMTQKQIVELLI